MFADYSMFTVCNGILYLDIFRQCKTILAGLHVDNSTVNNITVKVITGALLQLSQQAHNVDIILFIFVLME